MSVLSHGVLGDDVRTKDTSAANSCQVWAANRGCALSGAVRWDRGAVGRERHSVHQCCWVLDASLVGVWCPICWMNDSDVAAPLGGEGHNLLRDSGVGEFWLGGWVNHNDLGARHGVHWHGVEWHSAGAIRIWREWTNHSGIASGVASKQLVQSLRVEYATHLKPVTVMN